MSDFNEIERYRAVLNHILPMALTEAAYGSQEWEEAVGMIKAALAQEDQRDPGLENRNHYPIEL